MNLPAEAAKGSKASQLLENEIFKEVMGKLRQGIMDTWAESPIRDIEGQTSLRLMLKLHDDFMGHVVSIANTGKMAAKQIENESKAKELAKAALQGLSSIIRR